MEASTEIMILEELRAVRTEVHDVKAELQDFRKENEKRWEENDKRWEQNEKRWEENDRRWEQNEKELKEMNKRLDNTNDRVTALEKGRIDDRRDILVVLDTMQKSISKQFVEMKEYMDEKFEKIFALQRVNDNEHDQFKDLLRKYNKRFEFQNVRISNLEEWKQDFDMGEYTVV